MNILPNNYSFMARGCKTKNGRLFYNCYASRLSASCFVLVSISGFVSTCFRFWEGVLRARLQMFFVCNITLVRMNTFTNNNLILIVCKSPLTMYFANEYRFMTVNFSLRSFTIVFGVFKRRRRLYIQRCHEL